MFFFIALVLMPSATFADSNKNSEDQDHWVSEVVRIPITLNPVAKDGQFITAAAAQSISGYADFWIEKEGRFVFSNWVVTMDSPGTYITSVNLSVYYSGNAFNNGDHWEAFVYPLGGPRVSAANQGLNIYSQPGTYSATLSGSVWTTKGQAFVISPNKTIHFSLL
ncbi:hypothetical protein SAMN04487969_11530 [Paenibacillus algorifonticola]|uniref:Uncharacterized protein n=1 Tax=Paenibacillus algorifonticola TaxID=684063 RepID=A0A1I2G880_9BACL|nr:hypothetical protein [Paenibacillus algorifonticola]SFF13914.1 hypothetical protein SAMN04487969_11530 [Paenibacillus algorifonticola]